MNPGLRFLLRTAPRRLRRSLARRFRGPKGIALAIGLGIVALVILAPAVGDTFLRSRDPVLVSQRARLYGPLSLLAMTGLTLLAPAQRRGGLYFRPPEIGMLFPAPVTRRELLLYHVAARAQVQVLSGLWVTVFVVRYAPTWYGCVLGVTLALIFLQLLSQTVALVSAAAGARLSWPVRWGLLLAGLVAVVLGGLDALAAVRADQGAVAAVAALAQHPAIAVLTAPFVPFVRTFAALGPLDVVSWAGAGLVVNLLLVALLARLDVAYEEAALDVSRKVRRRLQRMRGGGAAFAAMGPGKARFAVPRFPYARGAGPIAWRQTVEIVRNTRAVVMSLVLLLMWPAFAGGAMMMASSHREGDGSRALAAGLIPMVIVFSIVSTQNIGFDFRRDLDRIPVLRSYPVSPMAVAAGQIAPSAVLLTLLQTIVLGAVIIVLGAASPAVVIALPVALVPLAWAVFAVDNGLFLLLPHRVDPDDAGNVGFMGRMMLVMFLKFVVLGALLLVAGGLGAGIGFLAGRSVLVGALVAMAVLVGACVVLTWLVARAYDAFDPARDAPP